MANRWTSSSSLTSEQVDAEAGCKEKTVGLHCAKGLFCVLVWVVLASATALPGYLDCASLEEPTLEYDMLKIMLFAVNHVIHCNSMGRLTPWSRIE